MPDVKELVRAMKLKYGGEDDYTLYKGFKVHINLDENVVQEEIDDLI
jgi:hypothetical protein